MDIRIGKNLSLLLFFLSLILCQSCISTDASLSELSEFESNVEEETFLKDSVFIIEDRSDIVLTVSDRQKIEDAELINALEDSVTKEQSATQKSVEPNELLEYQTKKNETLMLIAFNIYGDYRKWREIASLNEDVLGGNYDLSHRPILRYRKPLKPYTPPIGNPYLIKRGDSLSLISKKVYGNWREWPVIYKNNPQQIRDPDLIFAGFTLYYPSLNKMALQLY